MNSKEETNRYTCMEELDMCCQSLCNKDDVYKYIQELETEITLLQNTLKENNNGK